MQSLSFILPITLNEKLLNSRWRDDPDTACDLRLKLLLKTFLQTFDLDALDLLLVVCPASDEKKIRSMLHAITMDSRFQVMNELDICPELSQQRQEGKEIPGWYIQQIIKLASAKEFSTSFYLTLDSDIICRKPFGINSLMPNGKALLNIETLLVYLRIYKPKFALYSWKVKRRRLIYSAELLGYKRKLRYRHQSYGETPVLMHTSSVKDLMAFLSQRHGSWFDCLAANHKWTEYALFFQFLEMSGSLYELYQKGDHNAVLDLESSAWENSDNYNHRRDYSPRSILSGSNEKAGAFVAIQSYLEAHKWLPREYTNLRDYYAALEEHILD